jgi:hypothetical protein
MRGFGVFSPAAKLQKSKQVIRNSTIVPKKKVCVSCKRKDYVFSRGRCKGCATREDSMKRIAECEEQEMDESLSNLTADLDAVFSRYIRLKYCNEYGEVKCFTSDKKMRWQEAQCGHYIPRTHMATRWMEQNCRPQSEHDNCILSGNIEVFKERLEAENSGITTWLTEQSREVVKPTRDELKGLIANYRFKVRVLEKKIKKKEK